MAEKCSDGITHDDQGLSILVLGYKRYASYLDQNIRNYNEDDGNT